MPTRKIEPVGQVVITYEEQDFSAAREIARELEIAGYATWYRWRDGCVGPSFVGQVERRISDAGALIPIVSQSLTSPVTSSWLASDIETARDCGTKAVVVITSITKDELLRRRPEWAEALGSCAFIRLNAEGVRAMLPRLIDTLRGLGIAPCEPASLPRNLAELVNRYRLPAVVEVYDAIYDRDIAHTMPHDDAMKYKAIPLECVGNVVVIAMSDPSIADDLYKRYFGSSYGVEPVLASEESIIEAIRKVYA